MRGSPHRSKRGFHSWSKRSRSSLHVISARRDWRRRPFHTGPVATQPPDRRIKLIQTTIDSKSVGAHFNNLVWRVLDFKSSYTFLTGDRPIIMTNGMNKMDSHLAIPIGPRKLFIAAHTTDWADALMRDKADNVIALKR